MKRVPHCWHFRVVGIGAPSHPFKMRGNAPQMHCNTFPTHGNPSAYPPHTEPLTRARVPFPYYPITLGVHPHPTLSPHPGEPLGPFFDQNWRFSAHDTYQNCPAFFCTPLHTHIHTRTRYVWFDDRTVWLTHWVWLTPHFFARRGSKIVKGDIRVPQGGHGDEPSGARALGECGRGSPYAP